MNGPRARRRLATGSAAAVIVALPLVAFFVAPSARADDTPGANLAGINASSSASGVEIAPLLPGVVPAGPPAGNVVDVQIPYAASSTATGPSSTSVGSPAWPGDTATGAGNAIATFSPNFPPALVQALNYSILARADYPAQVSAGTSSSYNPPGSAGSGVGTASARAADTGASAQGATSQESFGSGAGGITVASSTAGSATQLAASSVQAASHAEVGTIKLLGGIIQIAGLTSDATAGSDGNLGKETSDFRVGAVTVAGVSASIGPNGISLDPSGQTATLVPIANQALTALKQAGITVHTVAPVSTVDGPSATVASGALAIQFLDDNIPNPNGQIPLSTVGFLLNLGQSQASANATALPPIPTFPSTGNGGNGGLVSSGNGLAGSAPVTGASALPAPGAQAVASAPARPASGAGAASSQTGAGPTTGALPAPAATLLGAPVKVAWVVIAFLLSLVAAGPLLSYANWQLLRGRKS